MSATLLAISTGLALRAGLILAAGSRPSEFGRVAIFVPAFATALYGMGITQPLSRDMLLFFIAVGHQLLSLGSRWFESRPAGNGRAWILAIFPAPLLWASDGIRHLDLPSLAAASALAGGAAWVAMRIFQRLSDEDSDLCLRWSSRVDFAIAAVFFFPLLFSDPRIASVLGAATWRTQAIVLTSAFLIFKMVTRSRS